MNTYREKLGILSEMIAFARSDAGIKESEHTFLLGVSRMLGIDQNDFRALLDEGVNPRQPKTQMERILQFHRLLLLMNIDQEQHPEEIRQLHNIGLHMGLRPSAVQEVLAAMHRYPDLIIPPRELIDIFRKHEN
ncbi:hypothetical protein SAMN04490243_2409 [Robiginitalea myxolifaciens]|uniref:Tellurite resistance protein TerB n=2 Tax=Robiginitalea myxolifaciens TaxID=400055 RepID=A0A1I6H8V8_9FLAO|nr:hypothetical protein SAMN04490243_2409 [Robiginitalea myxolifaciens]